MAHRIRVGVAEVVQDDVMSALYLKRAMLLSNLLFETRKSHLRTRSSSDQCNHDQLNCPSIFAERNWYQYRLKGL